jgi:hypothetical protein
VALCLAGAREWKKIEKKDATGGGPSSEKRIIQEVLHKKEKNGCDIFGHLEYRKGRGIRTTGA